MLLIASLQEASSSQGPSPPPPIFIPSQRLTEGGSVAKGFEPAVHLPPEASQTKTDTTVLLDWSPRLLCGRKSSQKRFFHLCYRALVSFLLSFEDVMNQFVHCPIE